MSLAYLEAQRSHPARTAAMKSISYVESGNRAAWLALWAANARIEDPVGISPMDPTGQGHQGTLEIENFYDVFIASVDVRFHIRESFACGNECANVGTITTRSSEGEVRRCELVMLYRVDDSELITSLRAFWEFEALVDSSF